MEHENPKLNALHDLQRVHEQWFKEICKADERLRRWPDLSGGITENKPETAALRWAIALSKADLASLSEGDFRNLQFEIDCFRRFRMKPPEMPLYVVRGRDRAWGGPPIIGRDGIARIHQWLRQGFQSFISRTPIEYVAPELHQTLCWHSLRPPQRGKGKWSLVTSREAENDLNLYAKEFFELLTDHINDLAVCEFEGCKTGVNNKTKEKVYELGIYVRDRSNQHYCSKKCRWAAVKRAAPTAKERREPMGKNVRPKERRNDATKKGK